VLFRRLIQPRELRGAIGRDGGVKLGRYQLVAPLGVGGMAEVFKARMAGPGGFARDVVIKRILPAHGNDPEFVRMFADEAKILGLLHHPNVVQVLEFGEDDGMLFLAMEYVEGPSLSRVLRTMRATGRKLPPAVVAYIAREICRALDYVHNLADGTGGRLNAIHRDVTPSNILLTPMGGVKLLDFGVATFRDAGQITKTGTVKGKPAYLAPEQLEGAPIDGRVDLFSLGIVMHEMLTLQHLFAGDSDLGTVKKIMEMKIPRPSSKREDVPAELERIVMRALERDPADRFASAAEMARALDDFVVASGLHVHEVVAFVHETSDASIQKPPVPVASRRRPSPAGTLEEAPTRKDLGLMLKLRNTGRVIAARPRLAVAAGVMLVLASIGTAFGIHAGTAGASSADASRAAAAAAPGEGRGRPGLPRPGEAASVQRQR
jgi:serine/threonine protein kinase